MNRLRNMISKKPVMISAVILVIVVIAVVVYAKSSPNGSETTMVVYPGQFLNQVSVSGKVVPESSANLGFDQGGRVEKIYAEVGDRLVAEMPIASLENTDLKADVSQKQANLEREQARLSSVSEGTRPEELIKYSQQLTDASSALILALRTSYFQTEDAIVNKADVVFDNGDTVNPTFLLRTDSDSLKRAIEAERLKVKETLADWKKSLPELSVQISISDLNKSRLKAIAGLQTAKTFMDDLGSLVATVSVGNSGMAEGQISTVKSAVSAASIAIASAASTEQTADSLWNSAKTTFNLYNSGSRRSDIDVQISNVKAAQADLVSAKARLAKSLVTAPFTGILTRIDTKVGEVVSASQAPFTMMTDTGFEIESYIPEINISNIKVNDPATVTLDAYGSSVSFDAVVISVDPAETIRDGVSTYRVKIRFKAEDPRIRSGMTANVIITTDKRENILSVPQGIVTEKDSKKFVTVVRGNTETVTEVTTGSISSTGQTEILSGLSAGDVVLLQAP